MGAMDYKIFEIDPNLKNYRGDIELRMDNLKRKKQQLLAPGQTLSDIANGYLYFGIHPSED